MASVVLIFAVLASLAGGVLLAYGICQGLFAIFRMHAMSVATARKQVTVSAQTVQG